MSRPRYTRSSDDPRRARTARQIAAAEKRGAKLMERDRRIRERLSRNPAPKLKRLNKSTGWLKASSVKIRRNKGKYEVLIRRSKPRRKAATKRPARRKTTRRRR